ncbi:MAG: hypothetical protein RLZZ436_2242, partial [Planctomycetota bacterium]
MPHFPPRGPLNRILATTCLLTAAAILLNGLQADE